MHIKVLAALMAGAAFMGFAAEASAHGAWIAERWGKLAVVYGHGPGDDPYDPAKLTGLTALAEDGKEIEVKQVKADNHVVLEPASEPALIALEFDNGFWTQDAEGKWSNKPKNEVPGAKEGGRYIKNGISLVHVHDALPAFPPQSLQIVPLSNPIGRHAGDKIKVRVLFEGKPVSGKTLLLDYVNLPSLKSGPTDANGEVEIEIRNDGLNVIAVDHAVPLTDDPAADEVGYTATLTFVAEPHVDE